MTAAGNEVEVPVLIAGGGLIGLTAAVFLAQLDARELGAGAQRVHRSLCKLWPGYAILSVSAESGAAAPASRRRVRK